MNDYYLLIGLNKKIIKILNVNESRGGIIEVEIENRKKKVRCPVCNKFTSSVHGKLKPIRSVYLDACGSKVDLIICKKRYHCYNCGKIFTEELKLNTKNGSISNKVKISVRKDLLNYNLSLKYIAEKNRISEPMVIRELNEATSTITDYQKNLPKVISLDEFKADTNEGKKVLDILPNRKKEYLIQYFSHCNNRHSVEFVISDMYEPYLLVTKIMFPKAKYVVDRFHYITYIMDALDKIRIRLQKTYGEKSYEYKILKNKKNVSLLRKYGLEIDWWVIVQRYKNGHMIDVLPGDILSELLEISIELKTGYYLKEKFLDIVHHYEHLDVNKEIEHWISICIDSDIPEFIEAAGTISRWQEYIVNSFIDERYSNGFTEGINNKIKVIKRIAFGFRNFKILRRRILYIFNSKIGGGRNTKKSSNRKK